jgi:hypothetical protein
LSNFPGLGREGPVPPLALDPDLAAGPAHVVETVNQFIGIYDKSTGTQLFKQSLRDFFAFNPLGGTGAILDPVVTYDEQAGRFVVAALGASLGPDPHSAIELAVSNDANPLHGWSVNQINIQETTAGGALLMGDFDRLGWNADAWVITTNMIPEDFSTFDHVQVIAIDKLSRAVHRSDVYADRLGAQHFSLQPATMHGALPGDPLWLVEAAPADSSGVAQGGDYVRVVRMANVLSATPTFTTTHIPVAHFDPLPEAVQPGGIPVNAEDASVLNAAWRGNRLVASQPVGSGGVAHARWYEFNTSPAPTLTQSGEINPGPGVYTYYPAIEIAANGDLGMTYTQSSASEFISMYVTGRKATDPLGTMQTGVLVKAGDDIFMGGGRMGDYAGISVDPVTGTSFWVNKDYPTAQHIIRNWATWIANFSVGGGAALRNYPRIVIIPIVFGTISALPAASFSTGPASNLTDGV